MIFYASGVIMEERILDAVIAHRIGVLTSFAYKSGLLRSLPMLVKRLRAANLRLPYMLDSGAFTAWSSGKEIRLRELISTCNRVQDQYSDCLDFTFVALDKIPGRKGAPPTPEDLEKAGDISIKNFELMRTQVHGLVKPVFHFGDADRVAEAYAECRVLGLGASRDLPYEVRRRWAEQMGLRFSDKKLHGLAMTGTRMLRTVEWHSVDSASWVQWAGFGAVAWLRKDGRLKLISISKESPNNKKYDMHVMNMPPQVRQHLCKDIEAEGFTLEELRTSSIPRQAWNIVIFERACREAARLGVRHTAKGLFDATTDD